MSWYKDDERFEHPEKFFLVMPTANQVLCNMCEPGVRVYHNFPHALDVAWNYDIYLPGTIHQEDKEVTIYDYMAGMFFAFYHDFWYDPKKKDNEFRSARKLAAHEDELVKFFARGTGIPGGEDSGKLRLAVRDAIKAVELSANHFAPEAYDVNTRIGLMLDSDLKGLGAPFHTYWMNGQKIRLEYAHASQEEWVAGRTEFINHVLGAKQIFRTPIIRGEYEAQARYNLQTELAMYEAK
jgi:predicted metal-dependent HD superfamily phosphohydrolase